jgi:hypothetical protein
MEHDGFLFSESAPMHPNSTRNCNGLMFENPISPYPGSRAVPSAGWSGDSSLIDPKADGEIKRKRSSIACKACHDKRVRCDAAAQGLPCSNCRFRNAECVFIDSKRNRLAIAFTSYHS